MTVNYLKAGLAALLIVSITVLLLFERIDPTAAAGMLGLIVGLATGNGITAKHGEDPEPIFSTTRRDRRRTDPPDPDDDGGMLS